MARCSSWLRCRVAGWPGGRVQAGAQLGQGLAEVRAVQAAGQGDDLTLTLRRGQLRGQRRGLGGGAGDRRHVRGRHRAVDQGVGHGGHRGQGAGLGDGGDPVPTSGAGLPPDEPRQVPVPAQRPGARLPLGRQDAALHRGEDVPVPGQPGQHALPGRGIPPVGLRRRIQQIPERGIGIDARRRQHRHGGRAPRRQHGRYRHGRHRRAPLSIVERLFEDYRRCRRQTRQIGADQHNHPKVRNDPSLRTPATARPAPPAAPRTCAPRAGRSSGCSRAPRPARTARRARPRRRNRRRTAP